MAQQRTANSAHAGTDRHTNSSELLEPSHSGPVRTAALAADNAASSSASAAPAASSPQPSPAPTAMSSSPLKASLVSPAARVVVNAPLLLPTAALSSPLTSVSSLSAWPAPSPHSSELVDGSLTALPPAAESVRGSISHVFLLRSDVWSVLERWSQMPQLDALRFQPVNGNNSQQSPLLIKVWQKREGMDGAIRVMAELAQQASLDRMERGRRTAGSAGGGRGNRARTLLGYDGAMEQQQRHSGDTNHAVLANMRRVNANTTHTLSQLAQALHSAFPAVHASVTQSASATVASPLPPPATTTTTPLSSLDAIVSSSIQRCSSLYGGGDAGRGVWRGVHVHRLSVWPAAVTGLSTDSVAQLVVTLPNVMRVQVSLTEASQPYGSLRAVRVLSWEEELMTWRVPEPAQQTSSTTATATAVTSAPTAGATAAQPRSHFSLSCRHVMQLVQAQLTAHLHHCNAQFLSSASSSLSSLALASSSMSASPSSLPSSCALFHFLVHVCSYHDLFSAPCVCCGELLAYHDDTARLLPAVVRAVGGDALHATCLHSAHSDIPSHAHPATKADANTVAAPTAITTARPAVNSVNHGSTSITQGASAALQLSTPASDGKVSGAAGAGGSGSGTAAGGASGTSAATGTAHGTAGMG